MPSKLTELSSSQVRQYFRYMLGSKIRKESSGKGEISALCPFHDDAMPSLSVNYNRGIWICQAGCGQGNMIDFHMKSTGADPAHAAHEILEVLNIPEISLTPQPETIYVYEDQFHKPVYEVVRVDIAPGKKKIFQRQRDEQGNILNNLTGIEPILYRLPEVLKSDTVIVVEGEKDAELTRSLGLPSNISVTTNSGGAGKWREAYAKTIGKRHSAVFCDRDEVGRRHSDSVVQSLHRESRKTRLIEVPGYHDIGDWIAAGADKKDVLKLIRETPYWVPDNMTLFVSSQQLASSSLEAPDWAIAGVIERNSNGFITARPKARKSFLALDMALHMAAGLPWMGCEIPRPMRVGFVSREDSAGRTAWRLKQLVSGLGEQFDVQDNLWLNTPRQSRFLYLDSDADRKVLIENIRERGIEFIFLDVFNRLHHAEENDNTAMRQVLDKVEEIRAETGAGICLLHHRPKYTEGDSEELSPLLRGAAAIAGFAEFIIAIDVQDYASGLCRLRWQSKDSASSEAKFFDITTNESGLRINEKLPPSAIQKQRATQRDKQAGWVDGKMRAIGDE